MDAFTDKDGVPLEDEEDIEQAEWMRREQCMGGGVGLADLQPPARLFGHDASTIGAFGWLHYINLQMSIMRLGKQVDQLTKIEIEIEKLEIRALADSKLPPNALGAGTPKTEAKRNSRIPLAARNA